MDFTGTINRCAAVLLMLAAVAVRAQEAAPATPAPETKPDTKEVPTLPAKSTLEQFRSELFGPLEQYSLKNSADRALNPAARSMPFQMPRATKEMKEKREQQQQWIFQALNDLKGPPTLEDLAGMPDIGPDGSDRRKLSPMEKYYEDLDKKKNTSTNSMMDMLDSMWTSQGFMGSNGFNSMSLTAPGFNYMMKALAPGQDAAKEKGNGLGAATADDGDALVAKAQKLEVEDFKRLLNHGLDPEPAGPEGVFTPFNQLLSPPVVAMPAAAPVGAPAPQFPGAFAPANNGAASVAVPAFRPPTSAAAQPAFSPAVTTRAFTPPASSPAPKPFSSDPFKDNMPARRF